MRNNHTNNQYGEQYESFYDVFPLRDLQLHK